jgi:hypothetical protein
MGKPAFLFNLKIKFDTLAKFKFDDNKEWGKNTEPRSSFNDPDTCHLQLHSTMTLYHPRTKKFFGRTAKLNPLKLIFRQDSRKTLMIDGPVIMDALIFAETKSLS